MNVPPVLRPKRPRWLAVTAAIAAATIVLVGLVRWWRGWSAGDAWGLTFGTFAALLMLFAALYPVRRRLLIKPLKTVQQWLQFHVYGSTLAAVFVLAHTGLRLPVGQFGWWLFVLTAWTTVSGLIGVGLQKWIPSLIASQLSVEVIYDRIPDILEQLRADAAKQAEGASEVLQRFYDSQVQPALAGLSPSWSYVFDAHSGHDERLAAFDSIQSFVVEADKEKLADLKTIVNEKLQIEAHYSLQRLLRLWPLVHVPPAMVLMAFIVVHVAAVWYF